MTVKIDGTNTEANPAFTGADTDTGLQCGTNEVKLVTGGTARATVDSSGRLGVGTASPASLIHGQVSSGGAGATLESTATSGEAVVTLKGKNSSGAVRSGIFKYDNADLFRIGTTAGIDIRFETNDTERMRITSNGYVTKSNHPAFEVSLNTTDSTSGNLAPSHVQLNQGSHYSTSTGVFTAPVAGIYCFYYGSIKSGDGAQVVRVYMQVNGVVGYDNKHLRLSEDSGNYAENGSLVWTYNLAKDDQVRLNVGAGAVYGSTKEYFHFGGYLIG